MAAAQAPDRVAHWRVRRPPLFPFLSFCSRSARADQRPSEHLRLVEADDELAASDLPWQPLLFLVTDRSASSDPGVRLTAASALKVCMDLWELDPAVFSPYVRPVLPLLFSRAYR